MKAAAEDDAYVNESFVIKQLTTWSLSHNWKEGN